MPQFAPGVWEVLDQLASAFDSWNLEDSVRKTSRLALDLVMLAPHALSKKFSMWPLFRALPRNRAEHMLLNGPRASEASGTFPTS